MTIEEIKIGSWFKFVCTKGKCKYFGTAVIPICGKVYLFMRENGQGFFVRNGKSQVIAIMNYNFGRFSMKYIRPLREKKVKLQ